MIGGANIQTKKIKEVNNMAAYPTEDRIPIMSEQYFNKRESLIIPFEYGSDSKPVDKNVLAGMLANFESLGYKFGSEDILKWR